eukprot:gene6813-9059_t
MNVLRPFLVLFFAALSMASASFAQGSAAGTVVGRVTDAKSRLGLGGARVAVVGTALETFATQSGDYVLVNVPAGA